MNLYVDDALSDKIVVENLQRDYVALNKDIILLENRKKLEQYEESDLKYNREISSAIYAVLGYYTAKPDFNKWCVDVHSVLLDYEKEIKGK